MQIGQLTGQHDCRIKPGVRLVMGMFVALHGSIKPTDRFVHLTLIGAGHCQHQRIIARGIGCEAVAHLDDGGVVCPQLPAVVEVNPGLDQLQGVRVISGIVRAVLLVILQILADAKFSSPFPTSAPPSGCCWTIGWAGWPA